jgi:hypothetical protein
VAVDDAQRFEGNPLDDLIGDGVMRAIKAMEGHPYLWGATGPGQVTVTKTSGVIAISSQQYLDGLDFQRAIRRAREIRDYLRKLWLTEDTATAFRICQAYCMRVATSDLAYRREYETERCPHCGCHPQEHGRD